jgi:Ni/Fe-hydrogenase 1 B-type cytochrome subunit
MRRTEIKCGAIPRFRVYVWELPIRLTHWINAFCILFLSITGYYIGNPFIHAVSSKQYIMGWIRFIHFVSAYTFLMSVIVRIYWSFVGNKYTSIAECFPYSAKKFRDFVDTIKFYLLIKREPPYVAGHAPLLNIMYLPTIRQFHHVVMYVILIFVPIHIYATWYMDPKERNGLVSSIFSGYKFLDEEHLG